MLQSGRLPRMGFEPDQRPSRMESVNEFTDRMKSTLDEAKAALAKSKDDMTRYYNQRRTPATEYHPGDKVYLDAADIPTNRPSRKLSHRRLGPFPVVRKVGNNAYELRLPPSMSRKHPVFNVINLTPAPDDPIAGRRAPPPPLPEIIDGEEEWVVEEILDSKVMNRKLRYLVKWKDFGVEHNTWEPWDNIHAPDLIAEFYRRHPGAARQVRTVEFSSIPFRPITVSRRHFSEGGVDVRGHSLSAFSAPAVVRPSIRLSVYLSVHPSSRPPLSLFRLFRPSLRPSAQTSAPGRHLAIYFSFHSLFLLFISHYSPLPIYPDL
jgi:hypothetical protein